MEATTLEILRGLLAKLAQSDLSTLAEDDALAEAIATYEQMERASKGETTP